MTVAEKFGPDAADQLARWAIDALVEPPDRIDTATTRIPASLVREGRAILDAAGLDWRYYADKQRKRRRERAAEQRQEMAEDFQRRHAQASA